MNCSLLQKILVVLHVVSVFYMVYMVLCVELCEVKPHFQKLCIDVQKKKDSFTM